MNPQFNDEINIKVKDLENRINVLETIIEDMLLEEKKENS
jgi:hypothetical protein